MTLLLIIPAWLILLCLIAGLCFAARLGDAAGRAEPRTLEHESREEHGSRSLIAA